MWLSGDRAFVFGASQRSSLKIARGKKKKRKSNWAARKKKKGHLQSAFPQFTLFFEMGRVFPASKKTIEPCRRYQERRHRLGEVETQRPQRDRRRVPLATTPDEWADTGPPDSATSMFVQWGKRAFRFRWDISYHVSSTELGKVLPGTGGLAIMVSRQQQITAVGCL